jgi:hypothetical protein
MTCTVKVFNGTISLPAGVNLPDGAEVQVILPDEALERTFAERFAEYIGMADDLPSDLAANHDHYLHGHRKK